MAEKLTEHHPIRFGETQLREGLALAESKAMSFGEYIRRLLDEDLERHKRQLQILAGIFGHAVQPVQRNLVPPRGTKEDAPYSGEL